MYAAICPRLIDKVDCLVGQEAVREMTGCGGYGKLYCLVGENDTMEILIVPLQFADYRDGLLYGWFRYVDLPESSDESLALCEMTFVFIVCG